MSDRPRRRRSLSRGRSKSPPLEYKETSTRTVYKYATETPCYQDYYQNYYSSQEGGATSDALQYDGDHPDSEEKDTEKNYLKYRETKDADKEDSDETEEDESDSDEESDTDKYMYKYKYKYKYNNDTEDETDTDTDNENDAETDEDVDEDTTHKDKN